MHKQVLTENQIELLPLLESFSPEFGLVGGTAVALHLGYRRSVDFDLFTNRELETSQVRNKIVDFEEIKEVIRDKQDQYTVVVNGVGLTFMHYPYQVEFTDEFEQIRMPDLLTLAAMKAQALGRRAKWKDYVDLYFIMKDHHGFKQVVEKAQRIFGSEFNEKLFRSQLSYFEDIDYSEEVTYLEGFEVSQEQIKLWLKEKSLED